MSLDAQLAREQFPPENRRCPICRQFAYHMDTYRAPLPAADDGCYMCKIRPESALLKNSVTIESGE